MLVLKQKKEHTLGLNVFDILLSTSTATRTSNTSCVIRHESTLHMDTTPSRLGKTNFRNENTFLNDLTTSLTSGTCVSDCVQVGRRKTYTMLPALKSVSSCPFGPHCGHRWTDMSNMLPFSARMIWQVGNQWKFCRSSGPKGKMIDGW